MENPEKQQTVVGVAQIEGSEGEQTRPPNTDEDL